MDRRSFFKTTLSGIPLLSPSIHSIQRGSQSTKNSAPSLLPRRRIRDLGIKLGSLEPGAYNAITDVAGVKVGHTTIIKGEGGTATRTGVTVILPNDSKIYEENLFASYFNQNGWGEMTGVAAIETTGKLKTPIFLTGTYNVGIVYDAAMKYLMTKYPQMAITDQIVCPVVAECFDASLSDVRSRQISEEDVLMSIEKAKSGPVHEGAVGGGTGMRSFGFKAGIGTSSRKVREKFTVGVLVMANTAGRNQLRIDGVPVGKEIEGYAMKRGVTKSIILVAATDAPLLPYQLKKIGKRVAMGLAQTGAISSSGSGDIILAFSTGNKIRHNTRVSIQKIQAIDDSRITPFYQATVEATHEAIINALTMSQTMVGRNNTVAYGIPLDQVEKILKKYMRI